MEVWVHIVTFLAWTLGVAALTWTICARCSSKSSDASEDHFIAARALKWYIVAGSLMLTNLSTEQLVGLNGNIFADGCLAGVWWEAGAALAMLITATIVLPRYMTLGLATTSGFLGKRYDSAVRTLVAAVFLVYYVLVLNPTVLYTGALAIRTIFDLDIVPLWVISTVIGLLGAVYALAGGLRAVAISDSLNALGLLAFGLWVPIAALCTLPGGISTLFEDPNVLRSFVATSQVYSEETGSRSWKEPSVPWHVMITGLALSNMYYWSTNQVIVQRVLAAESLAQGQKGVVFAATMKVFGFSFLCMPGLIAIIFVKHGVTINGQVFEVETADQVYPQLVKAVMPTWSLGCFSAVLLGSVLSTFNSALNSAATLFGLEMYKAFVHPEASSRAVVRVSTTFGACAALLSFLIAPQLANVKTIFAWLQQANTVVSVPILTVFVVGILTSLPDAFAAKIGFAVAVVFSIAGQFVPGIHYLHIFFICFCFGVLSMLAVTHVKPLRRLLRGEVPLVPYVDATTDAMVDLSTWAYLPWVVTAILIVLAALVWALQVGESSLFYTFVAMWLATALTLLVLPSRPRTRQTTATTIKAADHVAGPAPDNGIDVLPVARAENGHVYDPGLPRLLGRNTGGVPCEVGGAASPIDKASGPSSPTVATS
mmetsp:Transcript_125477/g.360666  ORF Transcript_125477/g.360666 Transcript_125477/m.360666 type:complete len:654 (-) Transcript_125477:264-2225(-)